MSTSADTFADFVDHLAEALDDARITEATGEEWAARLHFSRYHFDRMIRSVAGEPPRAFRRRRRATCTSTHPAASGCPPETR